MGTWSVIRENVRRTHVPLTSLHPSTPTTVTYAPIAWSPTPIIADNHSFFFRSVTIPDYGSVELTSHLNIITISCSRTVWYITSSGRSLRARSSGGLPRNPISHCGSSSAKGYLQNPCLYHPAVVLHLLMSLVRDWIPGSRKRFPVIKSPYYVTDHDIYLYIYVTFTIIVPEDYQLLRRQDFAVYHCAGPLSRRHVYPFLVIHQGSRSDYDTRTLLGPSLNRLGIVRPGTRKRVPVVYPSVMFCTCSTMFTV